MPPGMLCTRCSHLQFCTYFPALALLAVVLAVMFSLSSWPSLAPSTCTRLACPILAAQNSSAAGVWRVQCQEQFGELCVTSHGAKWTAKWMYWRLNISLINICLGIDRVASLGREERNMQGQLLFTSFLFLEEFLNTQPAFADPTWQRQAPKTWGFRHERWELFWTLSYKSSVLPGTFFCIPYLKLSKAGVAASSQSIQQHYAHGVQPAWWRGSRSCSCAEGQTPPVRHSCAPVAPVQLLLSISTAAALFTALLCLVSLK